MSLSGLDGNSAVQFLANNDIGVAYLHDAVLFAFVVFEEEGSSASPDLTHPALTLASPDPAQSTVSLASPDATPFIWVLLDEESDLHRPT